MFGGSSPARLAERLMAVSQAWIADEPSARTDRAQKRLLGAVAAAEPTTLNDVARAVGRGAPAVSRSIDALVRAGLIDRSQDPDNRRRLALRLTEAGRERLADRPSGSDLAVRLERFAQSELRAIERAVELFERAH
jgi:DNA-binding MarR family transcriptional regulator